MYVYRWDMMRDMLERHKDWDGDPYEALMVEYVDPMSGGPVFKTITFFVQMLRPGEKTLPLRQIREPAGRAVRGLRLLDRRRQALRLEAVRHARGAGRRVVRACECVLDATGRAVRRERRARVAGVLAVQEVGPSG